VKSVRSHWIGIKANLEENKKSHHNLGRSGEEIALQYLKRKRYRIINRSFRMFRGEIDIIAFERKTLVFFEVKTRRSQDFGLPEESVNTTKQNQIRKVANGFLAKNKLESVECRFDIISISFDEDQGYSIRHIKDAF
jgi:putative endonuclease